MEQSLWIGIVPLLILAVTAREWRSAAGVRVWILAAVVFLVLALGPFLRIGGLDTALPLPDAVLRYVPVFSNARIPGRAVVVVQLAVAVLLAYALVRRATVTAILLVVLVAAEAFPARLPLSVLPSADAVDDRLRTSSSPGAVAELPLGLRDGFVNDGAFDHRALVHQMSHGRALAGGFVARLAPAVREMYAGTAILSDLVRLSTPSATEYRLGADARGSGVGSRDRIRRRQPRHLHRRAAPAIRTRTCGFPFRARLPVRAELYAIRAAQQLSRSILVKYGGEIGQPRKQDFSSPRQRHWSFVDETETCRLHPSSADGAGLAGDGCADHDWCNRDRHWRHRQLHVWRMA